MSFLWNSTCPAAGGLLWIARDVNSWQLSVLSTHPRRKKPRLCWFIPPANCSCHSEKVFALVLKTKLKVFRQHQINHDGVKAFWEKRFRNAENVNKAENTCARLVMERAAPAWKTLICSTTETPIFTPQFVGAAHSCRLVYTSWCHF